MRLRPLWTAEAHPGSLLLLVHWSSAPRPTACIWSSYRGFPPCCCCVTSLQVQPWCSPRPHRLELIFLHGIRTERAAEATFKDAEIFGSSGSVQTEARLGFPLIVSYLTDLCVCARVCVCVCWVESTRNSPKLENHWHISGRSAAAGYINERVSDQCRDLFQNVYHQCKNHCCSFPPTPHMMHGLLFSALTRAAARCVSTD